MASHDGKRRSHQRFLRNLPKQKPGKYLKVIPSSVADLDLALRKGGEGEGEVFCRLDCRLFFLVRFLFFFFTQNKEGRSGLGPQGLFPRFATALARVGLIAAYLLFWAGLFDLIGFHFSCRRACTGAKVLLVFISVWLKTNREKCKQINPFAEL